MNAMIPRVRHFLVGEDGPTAVEYAVMLALILVVCITVVRTIGESTLGSYGAFGAAMSVAGGS